MPVTPVANQAYKNIKLFDIPDKGFGYGRLTYKGDSNFSDIFSLEPIKSKSIATRSLHPTSIPLSIKNKIEESKEILSLKYNWDDEGAIEVSRHAFDKACSFLNNYAERILDVCGQELIAPVIAPVKDGSVDLEWNLKNSYLLINFKGDKDNIAFYYLAFKEGERVTFDANGQLDTIIVNDKFASDLVNLS